MKAAAAGLGLADLSALFAEMYERARADLPDEDPARGFADRGVRLETTFQGAGVMTGDLTPECAAVVATVLDALSAPAGADDDRTREQRYHDALQEAMRRLVAAEPAAGAGRAAGEGVGAHLPGGPAPAGRRLGAAGGVDRAGPGPVGRAPRRRVRDRRERRGLAGRGRRRGDRVRRGDGPIVTGDVNVDALGDLVRLCVELDARQRDGARDAAWAALEQAVIGKAVDLLSGPGGLACVPAPPPARRPAGRAEPAAGHRLRRDHPGGDPQRGDAAG